jgi:hypothetical protein
MLVRCRPRHQRHLALLKGNNLVVPTYSSAHGRILSHRIQPAGTRHRYPHQPSGSRAGHQERCYRPTQQNDHLSQPGHATQRTSTGGGSQDAASPSRDPVGIAAAQTTSSSGHALPCHADGRRPVPRDHGYALPFDRDHLERHQSGLLGRPAPTGSVQSTVPRTSARSMWNDGNKRSLSRCGARTVSPCTDRLCT